MEAEVVIVVFDEMASSADSYSERQIDALLHTKLKEKTVIVVTHRMEVLEEAAQAVRLVEGEIA